MDTLEIKRLPSLYIKSRRGIEIRAIVLHYTAGRRYGDLKILTGLARKPDGSIMASSHLWVGRDGEIIQFVPIKLLSGHAGTRSGEGLFIEPKELNPNTWSIGIEIENLGLEKKQDKDRKEKYGDWYGEPYTINQYEMVATLDRILRKKFPQITRILTHAQIDPLNKRDIIAGFDWDIYRQYLSAKEFPKVVYKEYCEWSKDYTKKFQEAFNLMELEDVSDKNQKHFLVPDGIFGPLTKEAGCRLLSIYLDLENKSMALWGIGKYVKMDITYKVQNLLNKLYPNSFKETDIDGIYGQKTSHYFTLLMEDLLCKIVEVNWEDDFTIL